MKKTVKRKMGKQKQEHLTATSLSFLMSELEKRTNDLTTIKQDLDNFRKNSALSNDVKAPRIMEIMPSNIAVELERVDSELAKENEFLDSINSESDSVTIRLQGIQTVLSFIDKVQLPAIKNELNAVEKAKSLPFVNWYFGLICLEQHVCISSQDLCEKLLKVNVAIEQLEASWDLIARPEEQFMHSTIQDHTKSLLMIGEQAKDYFTRAYMALSEEDSDLKFKSQPGSFKLNKIYHSLHNLHEECERQFTINKKYCDSLSGRSGSVVIAKVSGLYFDTTESKNRFHSIYNLLNDILKLNPFSAEANSIKEGECISLAEKIISSFEGNISYYSDTIEKLKGVVDRTIENQLYQDATRGQSEINNGEGPSLDKIQSTAKDPKTEKIIALLENQKAIKRNIPLPGDPEFSKMLHMHDELLKESEKLLKDIQGEEEYWKSKIERIEERVVPLLIQEAERINQMILNNEYMTVILASASRYYIQSKNLMSTLDSARMFFSKSLKTSDGILKKDEILNKISLLESRLGAILSMFYKCVFGEEYTSDSSVKPGMKKLNEIHEYLVELRDKINNEYSFYSTRIEKASVLNGSDDLHQIVKDTVNVVQRQKCNFSDLPDLFKRVFDLYPCTAEHNREIIDKCNGLINEISSTINANEIYLSRYNV